MGRPDRWALPLGMVLSAMPMALAAQSTGVTTADLKVLVRDEAGRPLPGVSISMTRMAVHDTLTGISDARGACRLRMLPVGSYLLRATCPGMEPLGLGISLQVGSTRTLDLTLYHPTQTDVIRVFVDDASSDLERTQISKVVDESLISNLPINRRSFSDFSLTTPFVAAGNLPTGNGVPDSGLSFAGMTPRQNNFLLDGLDNNDLGGGALRASISQEAVQEFQVISGGPSAESGRALGGIVNTITKQGANDLRGSVFYFHRPGSLDSKSPLGTDTDDYRLTQYGASLGGPILKDKLFYFVAVERLQKTDVNIVTIDPTAVALISAAGFRVETGELPYAESDTSGFLRLDWVQNPSSRWTFRALFGYQKDENAIPWGGLIAKTAGGSKSTHDQTFTFSNQWVGTSWFNDFRVMLASRDSRIDSLDPSRSVYVEILGSAVFGTQRLTDQQSQARYIQLADTLTTVRGNHTLKGGIDLLHSRNEADVPQNFAGLYRFQAIPEIGISSPLMAFAAPNPFGGTGIPVAFVQSYGNARGRSTSKSEAVFLQDDWQLHPAFLLKLGLRFERETLPTFPASADYDAIEHPPSTVDPVL
ncbi:MAG: TonB-dependent receptor, partial [Holophagaceae bacterium]|nr:TonB-dependent receptor [Holophagaceae bacterium]